MDDLSKIKVLPILDHENSTLFDTEAQYIVPLYQRAYAWGEKEILQLIHDIYYMNPSDDATYHLGSLIVSRCGDEYEVIDGQQRLTTLFIILKCLWEKGALPRDITNALRFSCRDKSNYTLKNLSLLDPDKQIEENIRAGRAIVLSELNKPDFSIEQFVTNLKKVILYRIEVPENTDLNRYFEIMNTRGEQLEQHDILKASLMSFLTDPQEQAVFADIWDACSDMTGYVQMHFKTDMRAKLFGPDWNWLPDFEHLADLVTDEGKTDVQNVTIHHIIRDDFSIARYDGVNDNSDRVRFESIIDFPYFLLHVLRVFAERKGIVSCNESVLIDKLLDDKKLTQAFERVVSGGIMDGRPICEQTDTFTREFIKCLLQCRFLFDKYILKREYVNEDTEGKWSLKELFVSNQKKKKTAYYAETNFGEHEASSKGRTQRIIMLQACFRVSYTSPKIMHWITQLLCWLNEDHFIHLDQLGQFEIESEKIAKHEVKTGFLDKCQQSTPVRYNMGVNTPHIVFNYLDYLLWKEAVQNGTGADFVFEFRNSVEHWFPQHPSENSFGQWSHEEGLNNFGNLCIIQRSTNAKFSNMAPEAKKSTFEDMIKKGSLKLRRMAAMTTGQDGKTANTYWRECACFRHEQEMLEKLIAACEKQ